MTKLIGTDILLRQIKKKDCKSITFLANNKKIADNLRDVFPHPYTLEDAKSFIDFATQKSLDHRFAIEYLDEFIGLIGLHAKEDVYAHNFEIGYWLGEPYWGKSIMSKSIKMICDYGFEKLKCHRIYAGVFEYNIGSMMALEKNGFVNEGISRQSIFKNGKYWNEHRYGLLKADLN